MLVKIDDLVAQVRKEAEANPDFNYEDVHGGSCEYVSEDGTGKCLVGKAMVSMGVSPDAFLKSFNNRQVNGLGIWTIRDYLFDGVQSGDSRLQWVSTAQSRQDGGETWGDAVKMADEYYPLPV